MALKPVSKRKKIILIILAVLLVLLLVAGIAISNILFDFALNPNGAITMTDLFVAGSAEPIPQEKPLTELEQRVQEFGKKAQAWFESDGHAVELVKNNAEVRRGCFFANEGHRYAIVCHGYGGNSAQMASSARKFYELGYSVLTPDAMGHGESDGKYYGMGWLEREDILGWIDAIVEHDPEAQIVLFGISMGGATVMMVSGEELPSNVKCIIEDCGYSSVWDEFALQLDSLFHAPPFPLLYMADLTCRLRAGYGFKEASAVDQLQKATLPMLFIHGEEDTFVPYSMLDVVYEACASPQKEKLTIPGAGHGEAGSVDPDRYWGVISAFLEKHVEF